MLGWVQLFYWFLNVRCTNFPANIWGTGIYTRDSSVCRAAIHSGVNLDKGGVIEIVLREGLNFYEASDNR